MSVVEQSISVVPDAVEAVEGWRVWKFNGRALVSLNGVLWRAGEEMTATCQRHRGSLYFQRTTVYRWELVEGGMSLEKCEQAADRVRGLYSHVPRPPRVAPPHGFGYSLLARGSADHESPDEHCSCGIYAGTDLTVCPSGGDVVGKVKMWGKVVPGERGWRAQYAYPSELHAPAKLANHPALLAYGVPIVVTGDSKTSGATFGPFSSPRFWTAQRVLHAAIALNVAAAVFNFASRFWL